MNQPKSSEQRFFTEETRRYIIPGPVVTASRINQLRNAATIWYRSFIGGRAIARYVNPDVPSIWSEEMAGKRVLVVGTGPSLDRVDAGFFDSFDAVLYINFAVRRARDRAGEYFFTTDIGPFREFLDIHGAEVFERLGKEHCVFAPIFLDQYQMMTSRGRELFSWIRYDRAEVRVRSIKVGPLRLPLMIRFHPRQPDWSTFSIPPKGRCMPVLDHTSALTAVVFAATMGAREIGMIGCDLSAGRAVSVQSAQITPAGNPFAGAIAELENLQAALARQAVVLTNHSWLV